MVRLKGAELLQSSRNTVHIFQFLMVRLKDLYRRSSPCLDNISIPYGSIKSLWRRLSVLVTAISIPYGSIKRTCCLDTEHIIPGFQFLMVRLKEKDSVRIKARFPIFQFLMVRLKAIEHWIKTPSGHWFQFLMVRLKDRVQDNGTWSGH